MSEDSPDRLTVIVPTWNGKQLLRTCLQSLQLQTVRCRVLVVDNGSTDSTLELVSSEFPEVDYLPLEKNFGFAKAVNLGIQRTKTEFVALLNNDTEVDPHWVEAGLKAFQRYPDYWFFASKMLKFWRRDTVDSAGDCYGRTGLPHKRGLGEPASQFTQTGPVLGASGGAAFYRRNLFDRIGLFDEGFYLYLEDVDLSLRAQFAGLRCLYLPEAIVYHVEAASDPERSRRDPIGPPAKGGETGTGDHASAEERFKSERGVRTYYSRSRVFWITRNRWQLMITYQLFRNTPWLALGWARSALFHLLKAGFFGAFLRGLAAGILLTPRALGKRRKVWTERTLATPQVCQLIAKC